MRRLLLILYPDLRLSTLKVISLIRDEAIKFSYLLLDLPVELEGLINKFAAGEISYEELLDEILEERLMPETQGSWEYTFKPLMMALPSIIRGSKGLAIRCYASREGQHARMEEALRLVQLTLRTALRQVVEVEEWRDALNRSIALERELIKEEARVIGELSAMGDSICLADMGGRALKPYLAGRGVEVRIHYAEGSFHFTPLAILKRKMALGCVGEEELERLVRCHIEYIRDYIYRFENRDRAYYEWVYDKIPWLRRRMKREELEILSRIVEHPY
ncbi:MAG: hypothetical protein QXD04_05900 [Candidatus Bathyarchaeia archaeon]